jgi:hypothetical protein
MRFITHLYDVGLHVRHNSDAKFPGHPVGERVRAERADLHWLTITVPCMNGWIEQM